MPIGEESNLLLRLSTACYHKHFTPDPSDFSAGEGTANLLFRILVERSNLKPSARESFLWLLSVCLSDTIKVRSSPPPDRLRRCPFPPLGGLMRTIFQMGFRPANPFEVKLGSFGPYRLGQWEDEGWEPTTMPTETTTSTTPTQSYTEPSEEQEWQSLQKYTTPTSTPKKEEPSTLESIAKGLVAGGAGAAAAYTKAEQEKAKQAAALKPGTVPPGGYLPGTVPSTPISSTTFLVGIGALALAGIVIAAVA